MSNPTDVLAWQAPGGAVQTYHGGTAFDDHGWTKTQQNQLSATVRAIQRGTYSGLSATPPLARVGALGDLPITYLAEHDAWSYYIANVAQSFAAAGSGSVRWRLIDYSVAQLEMLLDSRSLFSWDSTTNAYRISTNDHVGWATPGDPVRIFQFLNDSGILAPTPFATIVNLLDWCRANVVHNSVRQTVAGAQDQWQYSGWPPVESIIGGTIRTSVPQHGRKHVVLGCNSSTGFMCLLLRTANIPAQHVVSTNSHAAPHFVDATTLPCRDWYLCHADDPYTRQYTVAPAPFSCAELLIDKATFDKYFPSTASQKIELPTLWQRLVEVAAQHLSNNLLEMYLADVKKNPKLKTLADRDVTAELSPGVVKFLTPQLKLGQLQQMHLWSRMAAELQKLRNEIPPWDIGSA